MTLRTSASTWPSERSKALKSSSLLAFGEGVKPEVGIRRYKHRYFRILNGFCGMLSVGIPDYVFVKLKKKNSKDEP